MPGGVPSAVSGRQVGKEMSNMDIEGQVKKVMQESRVYMDMVCAEYQEMILDPGMGKTDTIDADKTLLELLKEVRGEHHSIVRRVIDVQGKLNCVGL